MQHTHKNARRCLSYIPGRINVPSISGPCSHSSTTLLYCCQNESCTHICSCSSFVDCTFQFFTIASFWAIYPNIIMSLIAIYIYAMHVVRTNYQNRLWVKAFGGEDYNWYPLPPVQSNTCTDMFWFIELCIIYVYICIHTHVYGSTVLNGCNNIMWALDREPTKPLLFRGVTSTRMFIWLNHRLQQRSTNVQNTSNSLETSSHHIYKSI